MNLPAVRGIATLDPPGAILDQCVETLHLSAYDYGRRVKRSDDPLANLVATISADPDGPLVALVTVPPSAGLRFAETLHRALPQGWALVAFTPDPIGSLPAPSVVRHVPSETPREFALKTARHIERIVEAQPPESPLAPRKAVFPQERRAYASIDDYIPHVGSRHVVRIDEEGVRYDFLSDLRPGSTSLVVFGQDAVSRSRVTLPHFFRWSWLDDLHASALILNDPTLYLDDQLNAGWWVGTRDRDFVSEGVEFVKVAASTLGLSTGDVLFVGASAGGFSALQMAACLQGSRALVDIPQVNLRTYVQRGESDAAIRAGLGFAGAEAVPEEFAARIDVIERFVERRYVPDFLYLQNERDATHVAAQRDQFVDRLRGLSTGAETRFESYSAWHLTKGGHFPLSRIDTLEQVHRYLARD